MPTPNLVSEYAENAAEFSDVIFAIQLHGRELLGYPGVVSVRPGFRFVNGKVTSTPAVQVTVEFKRDVTELDSRALLPRRFGSAVVDVVPASPVAQLRLRASEAAGPGPGGSDWRVLTGLPGDASDGDESAAGPRVPYVPPDEPLAEVDEEMTVICHSSVDTGFKQLSDFFSNTQQSLVSTMYEFTAPHVLTALLDNLEEPRTFEFILDGKGKRIGAGDLNPAQVTSRLQNALEDRLTFAWAANAQARQVTAGFFPSAYHIKVSVRDGEETWLSSGNWKNSGQPFADPFSPPAAFNASEFERTHNREWHVRIANANVSRQFEQFIRHDIEQAQPLQADLQGPIPDPDVMPDLLVPVPPQDLAGPPAFFPAFEKTGRIRVMPLFTPDKGSYFDFVKDMIASAKTKIYFENQSLAPRNDATTYMEELFLVLRDKSRDPDMDVKIIVRGDFDPTEILNKLQFWRFRMDRVRLLRGVHTKGIIVDDEMVLIGSHNWTSEGTTLNRDASVVFRDADIIRYYNGLFEYDWSRADDRLDDNRGPSLAVAGAPTPPGFVRVPWSSVFED